MFKICSDYPLRIRKRLIIFDEAVKNREIQEPTNERTFLTKKTVRPELV